MFIRKNSPLLWARWLPLTVLNISQIYFLFSTPDYPVMVLFFLGIIFNQYLLFIVVGDLTGVYPNVSLMPTWFCASLKLLALLTAFGFAMSYTQDNELILLEIYIFQLIILVLSIKRVVKKN